MYCVTGIHNHHMVHHMFSLIEISACFKGTQFYVYIGFNHGFQCSNIRWITRKVFEHKALGRVFKHLPSDPANV